LVMTPPETISDHEMKFYEISGLMNRPLHPAHVIEDIANVLDLDFKPMRAKLDKLGLFQDYERDKFQIVKERNKKSSTPQSIYLKESTRTDDERIKVYGKYLDELPEP